MQSPRRTVTAAAPRGTEPPVHWLDPLRLGAGRVLPNRVLPGPMHGVTTGAFCTALAARGLVRCWITPFLRISTGVPRTARLRAWLRPYTRTALPVVAQLMGTDIAKLCGAAARLVDLGVVGIDLNCACPSPTVTRHGAGGRRLLEPEWIRAALCALRAVCGNAGVSVKLRAGFQDACEMPHVLAAVRAAGPDWIALHYRTVAEGYGTVRGGWRRLSRARRLLHDAVLLGSGDLFSAASALEMYAQTGVDGVAPARGLLRNPWLLRDIERGCSGIAPAAHTDTQRLGWLLDVARAAQQARTRRHGFLIHLATQLFGAAARITADLHACADVDAVVHCLEHAAAEHSGRSAADPAAPDA